MDAIRLLRARGVEMITIAPPADIGASHVIDWGLYQEVRRCIAAWDARQSAPPRDVEAELLDEDWSRYDRELL